MALDQKFNNTLKSFDLVFKVVGTDFGTRSKVLIMVFFALKTFDLVPKLGLTTFDLLPKILAVDQTHY